MRYKAIPLWQPWANLVILGAKEYETRSWSTTYRGELLIYATKKWQRWQRDLCLEQLFKSALQNTGLTNIGLTNEEVLRSTLGCALGTVDLVDVLPVEKVVGQISDQERAFGDYSPGRYAWKLENPKPFPYPIPTVGRQGFFWVKFHCEECQEAAPLLRPLGNKWVCEVCWSEGA